MVRQPIVGGASTTSSASSAPARTRSWSRAHYDHLGRRLDRRVYPGADDNASGAAVLLGLARTAARPLVPATRSCSPRSAPRRPASSAPACTCPVRSGRSSAPRRSSTSTWSVATSSSGAPAARRPPPSSGSRGGPISWPLLAAPAASAGLDLIAVPARTSSSSSASRTAPTNGGFDAAACLAIHVSTSLHDDYHQPTDTPDRLVPAQLERVARTAAGLLDVLALRPRRGQESRAQRAAGEHPRQIHEAAMIPRRCEAARG